MDAPLEAVKDEPQFMDSITQHQELIQACGWACVAPCNNNPYPRKPITRLDSLYKAVEKSTWDCSSENCLFILLSYHALGHEVKTVSGVESAIKYVWKILTKHGTKDWYTVGEIRAKLISMRKTFYQFQNFVKTHGLLVNNRTGEVTITTSYESHIPKETVLEHYFRKNPLPAYWHQVHFFIECGASPLPEEN